MIILTDYNLPRLGTKDSKKVDLLERRFTRFTSDYNPKTVTKRRKIKNMDSPSVSDTDGG